MSRICCVALVFVLGLASVGFAAEPAGFQFQGGPDRFGVPMPSGLRFGGPGEGNFTVRTGDGTGGYDGYAPCGACGGCGVCVHWTQMPWYGSWDGPHYHGGRHGACGCGGF
jgi:hypothetical protein